MIRLQEYTPSVYYDQSRDFQFIGRLFDLVLNYTKSNIDILNELPFTESNQKLVDLVCKSLGFQAKHEYNLKQLTALCSVFSYVLRNKGNNIAIESACRAILAAEGIQGDIYHEFTWTDDIYTLNLYVPIQLSDINLLIDLLDYILPAGVAYRIYRATKQQTPIAENISNTDVITHKSVDMNMVNIPRYGDLNYEHEVDGLKLHNTFSFTEATIPQIDDQSIIIPPNDNNG